jgi:hypothetical protein
MAAEMTERQFNKMYGKRPKVTYPANFEFEQLKKYALALNHLPNIEFEYQESLSTVLDYMIYTAPAMYIVAHGGVGILTFKARAKSIDITRVLCNKAAKGLGGNLMLTFMFLVQKFHEEHNYYPKITLECIGEVGFGKNYTEMPVLDQVAFFKKWGFDVVRVNDNCYHMQWNEANMDIMDATINKQFSYTIK